MPNHNQRIAALERFRGALASGRVGVFGVVALGLATALTGIGLAFAAAMTSTPAGTKAGPESAHPETLPSPTPSGTPDAPQELPDSDHTEDGEPPSGIAVAGSSIGGSPQAASPSSAPSVVPQPDNKPPVISIGSLPAVIAVQAGCVASGFVVTASDESGVSSVEVHDDHPHVNVSQYWRDGDRFGFSGMASWPSPTYQATFTAQVVNVVIVATDTVGNQSSITRTFNYYDYSNYCNET